MNDLELFSHAIERYQEATGKKGYNFDEVISFLENEIEQCREKIKLNSVSGTSQLEAVHENTTAEIIKALADNGYNTITINCYKDIEKERENGK